MVSILFWGWFERFAELGPAWQPLMAVRIAKIIREH